MEKAIIQTEALTKRFGHEVAVDGLTFEVPEGKIFGFIGPSGCGKTTTLRLLTGVYRPTSGRAFVLGSDPTAFSPETRARIGYMLQHFVLYPDLSVWDNLRFASAIYGVQPFGRTKIREALAFVELGDDVRKLGRNLSGGMQRRLGLAATLVHDPELLFLDEPTGGVDPVLRRKFWDHFRDLQSQGRTLFVTTQYVSEAAHCDLVGVLVQGRLLTVDTPTGLRRRAFGGDVIDITVSGGRLPALIACIEEFDFIIEVLDVADEHARLVVSEASTAVPRLVHWCDEQDVEIASIEEHLPPFDDVFVKLVDREPEHG